jgi:hypothetical protein
MNDFVLESKTEKANAKAKRKKQNAKRKKQKANFIMSHPFRT